jgi:hypothetical protein
MTQDSAAPEHIQWRKALRSIGNGNCVEVGHAEDGVLVRDSQDAGGPNLGYTAEAWRSFALRARAGSFGHTR